MFLATVSVVVFFALFFVLPLYLVLRKGSRGEVTGPQDGDIDYEDPYRGASFWTNRRRR
ncbi:MAG: hypothetical protein ABJA87_10200 [bacterium]